MLVRTFYITAVFDVFGGDSRTTVTGPSLTISTFTYNQNSNIFYLSDIIFYMTIYDILSKLEV